MEKHEIKIPFFFFFYGLASSAASLFEFLPPLCEAAPLWRPYQSPSVDVIASHTLGGQGCEFRSRLMHNENQDLLLKLARHRMVHKYLTSPEKDHSHIDSLNPFFIKNPQPWSGTRDHSRAVCHDDSTAYSCASRNALPENVRQKHVGMRAANALAARFHGLI